MSKLFVLLDDRPFEIELQPSPERTDEMVASVNGESVRVRVLAADENIEMPEWTVIGDRSYEVLFHSALKQLVTQGEIHRFEVRDLTTAAHRVNGDGRVKAPIPGVVTRVTVELGQTVEPGQSLFVLEAMKMQNQIRAPRGGTLTTLNVSPGCNVMLDQVLAEIS